MKNNSVSYILHTLLFILCLSSCADSEDRGIVRKKPGSSSKPGKRIALVIGNGDYETGALKNPAKDAEAMSETLEGLEFEVVLKTDETFKGMLSAIREFGDRLKNAEVALFYYAGHGIHVNGNNYLLPVGTDIQHEDEIRSQAVDANLVMGKMESAGCPLKILVLDACRNNPYVRGKTMTRGLAPMEAPGLEFDTFNGTNRHLTNAST